MPDEPEAIVADAAMYYRATIKKLGFKVKTHKHGTFYRDGLPVNNPRGWPWGSLDPHRLYLPEHDDWQEGLDGLEYTETTIRNLKPIPRPIRRPE